MIHKFEENSDYKIRFYKRENIWYADIPERTEEDRQVAEGSNTFLDLISGYRTPNITIKFIIDRRDIWWNEPIFSLWRVEHDDLGAIYKVYSSEFGLSEYTIWVCNIAHVICGEHPESIYIIDLF